MIDSLYESISRISELRRDLVNECKNFVPGNKDEFRLKMILSDQVSILGLVVCTLSNLALNFLDDGLDKRCSD